MRRLGVLFLLVLPLAACGQNRYAKPAGPLKAEYYEIAADDLPAPGEHLRYMPAGERAGGFDIAVTEFVRAETGVRVALVGVVHVADAAYYAGVKELLAGYDVVLWEGIKPAGVTGAQWQASFERSDGEAVALQHKLAGWFGFQNQVAAIDYAAENFVHADMSMEEFRALGGGVLVGEGNDEDTPKSAALTEKVRSTLTAVEDLGTSVLERPSVFRSIARRMFAETVGTADIGTALDILPGLSELVLDKRNEVVMEKLEETLADAPASIAIFYGAAHMPDLEKRLMEMGGFERAGARWLRAWALRPALKQ